MNKMNDLEDQVKEIRRYIENIQISSKDLDLKSSDKYNELCHLYLFYVKTEYLMNIFNAETFEDSEIKFDMEKMVENTLNGVRKKTLKLKMDLDDENDDQKVSFLAFVKKNQKFLNLFIDNKMLKEELFFTEKVQQYNDMFISMN